MIEEKDKDFSIYEVPLSLMDNKLDDLIVAQAGADGRTRWTWTTGATCCTSCATPTTS